MKLSVFADGSLIGYKRKRKDRMTLIIRIKLT